MSQAPERAPNGSVAEVSTGRRPATWLVGFFLLFAVLGFGDATYLTIEHYANSIPPCSIVDGCETVLTSTYATIGPVPLALLGALYYLVMVVLTVLYLDTRSARWLRYATYIATVGFVVSVGLVALQFFVLHAVCLYCMGSAAFTTALFVAGMVLRRRIR